MSKGLKINPELMAKLKRANEAGVLRVGYGLQKTIKNKLNQHASNIGNGGQASPAGEPPGKKTGTLGRSIQVDQTNKDRVLVGTNLVYAKIQEFGGVIRPKKGRALPVPMNLEAQRLQAQNPGGLKNIPGLVEIKTRSAVYLVQVLNKGKGKKDNYTWGAVWMLKTSVRIPARPYMRPSLQEYASQATADYAAGFRVGGLLVK